MSCPGAVFHAHAPLAAEMRLEPTTRRLGTAWSLAWILSFVGHAGVAAVVLLAPLAERTETPDTAILVELIGIEAADTAPAPSSVHAEPAEAAHRESEDAPQSPEPIQPAEPVATKPEPLPVGKNAHTEALPQTAVQTPFAMPPPKPTPPQNMAVEFKIADAPQPPSNYPAATAQPRMESKSATAATAESAALLSAAAGSAAKAFGDNRKPTYPAYARRRGIEGRVVLDVVVAVDGKAANVGVAESSRHAILDEAALEAVRKWRFHPAREDGRAIESRLKVPVTFRLNEIR